MKSQQTVSSCARLYDGVELRSYIEAAIKWRR